MELIQSPQRSKPTQIQFTQSITLSKCSFKPNHPTKSTLKSTVFSKNPNPQNSQKNCKLYQSNNCQLFGDQSDELTGNATQSNCLLVLNKQEFLCKLCSCAYTHRPSLYKHMKKCHSKEQTQNHTIKCQEESCSFSCRNIHELRQHLQVTHSISMESETLKFKTTEGKQLFSCTFLTG